MVESLQKTAWRACGELKIELSQQSRNINSWYIAKKKIKKLKKRRQDFREAWIGRLIACIPAWHACSAGHDPPATRKWVMVAHTGDLSTWAGIGRRIRKARSSSATKQVEGQPWLQETPSRKKRDA